MCRKQRWLSPCQEKSLWSYEIWYNNEDTYPHNVAPSKLPHILELSDGSDDEDDLPPLVPVVGSNNDDEEEVEVVEKLEESAEAELG